MQRRLSVTRLSNRENVRREVLDEEENEEEEEWKQSGVEAFIHYSFKMIRIHALRLLSLRS